MLSQRQTCLNTQIGTQFYTMVMSADFNACWTGEAILSNRSSHMCSNSSLVTVAEKSISSNRLSTLMCVCVWGGGVEKEDSPSYVSKHDSALSIISIQRLILTLPYRHHIIPSVNNTNILLLLLLLKGKAHVVSQTNHICFV